MIRKGEMMGRGRDMDGGRPVEPGQARATGNDPDAVEVHRTESSGSAGGRSRAGNLGPDIPASGPTGGRTHEEEVLVSRGSRRPRSTASGPGRGRGGGGGQGG